VVLRGSGTEERDPEAWKKLVGVAFADYPGAIDRVTIGDYTSADVTDRDAVAALI
jgi:hypothetical protein